jgi:ParB-like nuclease domain
MSNVEKIERHAHSYDNLLADERANLLPMQDQSAYENLKADIGKQGLLEPIVLFEGRILDGRNRYRAAKELGLKLTGANFKTFQGTQSEAEAFVFATNFLRRQLSNAQKQGVIRTMIERYPDESNRQIARRCGISSHSVVSSVREKMNAPTPEQKTFVEFCKTWDALPEHHRAEFVKTFGPDIRELLAA